MSNAMNPLPSLIRATAWDAGNRNMRAKGRKVWSNAVRIAAVREQERLIDSLFSRPGDADSRTKYVRFGYAEQMQRAGLLDLRTRDFHGTLDRHFDAYVESFAVAA